MKVTKILLLGNDKKVQECRNRFISQGFSAEIEFDKTILNKLQTYDCIVLPLPTVSNGLISGTDFTVEELLDNKRPEQYVFFGNIDLTGVSKCFSYYYDETFLLKNSLLTAQGVLKLLVENTDSCIFGTKVAVIGYGRCGKMISSMLKGFGTKVTVFARRNASIAQAYFDGYLSENISVINDVIGNFDVIVNTVPGHIITESGISKLSSNNIYIEVASKPYGFDINKTDLFNFKYILGESLPGRFFPRSAGINIADTVIEILKEV
jgi:dipicolinate synthase subunit A